jgi:hypothetical protein
MIHRQLAYQKSARGPARKGIEVQRGELLRVLVPGSRLDNNSDPR